MAKCNEMTSGATMPLIFKFTMPLLLGNLLQQTYSLIDAAIVGKFLGISLQQSETDGMAVGVDSRGDEPAVRGHPSMDEHSRKHL